MPVPTREQREKLLHAIIFFVTNTRNCRKTKLCKLLFFLDFGVFRQTGKSVTGLNYFAWPKGPVPKALFEELKAPRVDLRAHLLVRELPRDDPDETALGFDIKPRKTFDDSKFTKRELSFMTTLAEIYRDATADQMVEATHLKGQPWHRVYEREKPPVPA